MSHNKIIIYVAYYDTKIFTPIEILSALSNYHESEIVLLLGYSINSTIIAHYQTSDFDEKIKKMTDVLKSKYGVNLCKNSQWCFIGEILHDIQTAFIGKTVELAFGRNRSQFGINIGARLIKI